MPLGIFKTRLYPHLLAVALLGLLSAISLQQWLLPGRNPQSAYYSLVLFGGCFIVFLWQLINGYTRLIIYKHKLIKQVVFKGSSYEILFCNVEAATIKNRLYRVVSRKGAESIRREVSMKLLMKDAQKIEFDLSQYPDHEVILNTIQRTDLEQMQMLKD